MTGLTRDYFSRLQLKYKYGGVMRILLEGLSKFGVKIRICYLFAGPLKEKFTYLRPPKLTDPNIHTKFIGIAEFQKMAVQDNRSYPPGIIEKRFAEGSKCFALEVEQKILSFIWVNDRNIKWECRELKDNEIYIFDTYTFLPFRGKQYSFYLQCVLFKELYRMGYRRAYSLVEFYNRSSLRIQEKLGSTLMKMILVVELFGFKTPCITLRNYPREVK